MQISVILTAASVALGVVERSAQQESSPGSRLPTSEPATVKPQTPPTAFIMSAQVIYALGDPIDIAFAVSTSGGSVIPRFEIVNENGKIAAAKKVNGRYLGETPGNAFDGNGRLGAIEAEREYSERITDIRAWYEMKTAGTYEIRFAGVWTDAKCETQMVTSNWIVVEIVDPATNAIGDPNPEHEIPLSEIWALDMPGTIPIDKSIRSARPLEFRKPEGKLIYEIRRRQSRGVHLLMPSREGFVVHGTGIEALRQAHAVLVQDQDPGSTFQVGEQLSLVFFSKTFGSYVHLERVQVHVSIVEVSYRFVSHMTDDATSHFALIPIHVDHAGTIRVEMKPTIPGKYVGPQLGEWINRIVVQSFSFKTVEGDDTVVDPTD